MPFASDRERLGAQLDAPFHALAGEGDVAPPADYGGGWRSDLAVLDAHGVDDFAALPADVYRTTWEWGAENPTASSHGWLGDVWNAFTGVVTSPAFQVAAGGVYGVYSAAAAGTAAAAASEASAGAGLSAELAAGAPELAGAVAGSSTGTVAVSLEEGLGAYTNIGGSVNAGGGGFWNGVIDFVKPLATQIVQMEIAGAYAPDMASPRVVPTAPGQVPGQLAPGQVPPGYYAPGGASLFSPADMKIILMIGGLALGAVVLVQVIKK